MVSLLKELSAALLDVLDEAVLGRHLVGVLLQAKALVSAHHGGPLKQEARVLGVACCECPTRVVGLKLGVANGSHALTLHHVAFILNGDKGDGGAIEARQVTLIELYEGLVGSPLQGVVEVVNQAVMLWSEG
jgi:hypothetical protein